MNSSKGLFFAANKKRYLDIIDLLVNRGAEGIIVPVLKDPDPDQTGKIVQFCIWYYIPARDGGHWSRNRNKEDLFLCWLFLRLNITAAFVLRSALKRTS